MTTSTLEVGFTCPATPSFAKCRVPFFSGTEEINGFFRFEIEVWLGRDESSISLDDLVGKRAALTLARPEGPREMHGTITQAEHIHSESSHRLGPCVRVILRSGMWLMSLTRKYRVFDGLTATEVIKKVCSDYQIDCDLAATTSPAANFVQYGESDLDLVTRLLASEGLLWLAVEAESGTTLHAVDSYDSLNHEVAVRFSKGMAEGFLSRFESRQRVTASEYRFTSTNAFRPRSAATDQATGTTGLGGSMAFADHPIGVRDPGGAFSARKPAKILLDRTGALAGTAKGESTLHLLAAGTSIEVTEHPYESYNDKWVLIAVSHEWSAAKAGDMATETPPKPASYANEFTCVRKAGALLRPKLEAPPTVHGLRLGVICGNGESGQRDIPGTTESSGVYGVKFQSEDGLIQYMRVAHPWAGPERGFHFPLEVGDEVVVGHEHGDPGRPFILGSLHGAENVGPVVATEQGKGYSGVLRSRTGHELRYDDDPGLLRILLKSGTGDHQLEFHDTDKKIALKTAGTLDEQVDVDHTSAVKGNRTGTIDGNRTTTIKKDDEVGVEGGRTVNIKKAETHTVGEDRTVTVTGAENHSIGKDLTQKVDGASTVTIAKDASLTIKGAHTIDVTKDLAATVSGGIVLEATKSFSGSGKTITLEADDTLTLKCGSAKIILNKNGDITIDGGKITVKGSGDVAIKGSKTAVN